MGNWPLFTLTFSVFLLMVNGKGCIKTGPCTCQSDTMNIDLNDMDLKSNEPRFTNVTDPNSRNTTYSYNPCYKFSEGAKCAMAAMVNQHVSSQCYSLGDNTVFVGEPETGTLALHYNKTTGGYSRIAVVKLICKQGVKGNLFSKGEKATPPTSVYTFELETEIVCMQPSSESSGISTGSILVILFFVFFAAYWIGGVIFLKYARGAQGKELIPNLDFWKDFPLLVRDGVVFVINGCKPRSTYEQI